MNFNLLCIALVAMLIPCVSAATISVGSNLQAAIDSAKPGDTLQVAQGTYDKIEISKSISLIGNGATIRTTDRDACIRVLADNVNISGFVVRDGFYGISLENVTNCNIIGNTVLWCTQPGIMLKFSNNNYIARNNASLNGLGGEGWYGIYLTNSNHNMLLDNIAIGNGAYGINLFPSCNNNVIRGNILEKNMYGLYMFRDCTDNLIETNIMSRNTNSGMDIRFGCNDNRIINNTIVDNAVAGITLMEDSGKNIVQDNDISGNSRYGIQIQTRSNNNAIFNNSISKSQTGIFLESDGNQIYGNRLEENVIQADDRGSNKWDNGYPASGNMWSDYLGKDEMSGVGQDIPGKDGIGDSPYKINDHAVDRYPLMGNQVQLIKIIELIVDPKSTTVGNNIAVKVKFNSKYELGQVVVRATGTKGVAPGGYVSMTPSGDVYKGNLVTALMDPGKYQLELNAKDAKGNELKDNLAEITVIPRGEGIS
jgi:nitrous oxidase accessory protein